MSHPIIRTQGAWKGSEVDFAREGLHLLSIAEIAEIDHALTHLKGLGELDFPEITPETFPLGTFGLWLAGLKDRLRFGCGFVMLRGIPRERYTADDMARIYFGLGSHLGRAITQSYLGELLGHVIDVSDVEKGARAYHGGGSMEMHSDSCDIVALMCLRAAPRGGASRIASAIAVHNALVERRPDLVELLYQGCHYRRTDNDGRHATSALSPAPIEIFAEQAGEVSCYFLGGYARRAEKAGDVRLTALQHEALAEMERLAASPEFHLDMSFAEGDIQFLNNRLILHGRTDFADEPAFDRRRHLLRLWLAVPDWPPLPAAQIFHTAEDRRLWALNRSPWMELPSTYFRTLEAQRAAAQ